MASARRPALFDVHTAPAALALALALVATTPARPASSAEPACNERHPTAIGQVACELARGLPASGGATLIVATPVKTDLRAQRLEELAARLSSLVAGELGGNARGSDRAVPETELHRLGVRDTRLVVLKVELAREGLSVTADVVSALPRFWERMRAVSPGSTAHAFATRPLDAELRAHLPPVPLVLTRIDKSVAPDDAIVALACGDADGERGLELVVVGRHRVQVGRIDRGRFSVLRSKPWAELAEIAPSPLREPLGSAVVPAPGVVEVGISDRATAVRLDAGLAVVARYREQVPWPGGGCASFESTGLSVSRVACAAAPRRGTVATEIADAVAGARVVRPDGSVLDVQALRRQRDGRLELVLGQRRAELPERVGAQIALADLDGDGKPELVTTNDTADPAADFLRVDRVADEGAVKEAFRVPVPSGVRALTTCPSEGDGLAPIVAATGDGLWVLR